MDIWWSINHKDSKNGYLQQNLNIYFCTILFMGTSRKKSSYILIRSTYNKIWRRLKWDLVYQKPSASKMWTAETAFQNDRQTDVTSKRKSVESWFLSTRSARQQTDWQMQKLHGLWIQPKNYGNAKRPGFIKGFVNYNLSCIRSNNGILFPQRYCWRVDV